MSTLFFIGNGFDLNCGMHARFDDVYRGYAKEESSSDVIKKFKKALSAHVENWGDFEKAVAKYAEKLGSEEELLECVRDFTVYMERYLREEEKNCWEYLRNESNRGAVMTEFDSSVKTFYAGINHNVDTLMHQRMSANALNIHAVSFTYTRIFDKLFQKYLEEHKADKREVIHIHGLLMDDPILGIDNEKQIRTSFSLTKKGKRSFIKPFFNEVFDENRVRQVKDRMEKVSTICVFGASLGDTDLTWRDEIINWLKGDGERRLFVYRNALADKKYRTAGEKMDLEDDEKEKMLAAWGVHADDEICNRIHIPCGRNIFNIQNAIERENANRQQAQMEKKKMDDLAAARKKELLKQLADNIGDNHALQNRS